MIYFQEQDDAWEAAHPELAKGKQKQQAGQEARRRGFTTPDGRPLNMRGTGMG